MGSWDAEADVVVVGLGCAGAAAALDACAAGADVLVLERAGGGGGTSAMSGGVIYLGGGTPVQRACGFDDTPEAMLAFLRAACGPEPDEAKLVPFCEQSTAHFDWFVEHGVPFKASFFPEPGMEPPTDDGLVFTGGEDAHPFAEIAPPAPRGHKPRAKAAAGGFLMQRLVDAVERTSARVVTDTRVASLIVARDGRVTGVAATEGGRALHVRARRGVVLTAGGFIQNAAMLVQHAPLLGRCSMKLGVDGDDGQGIRMATALGAAVRRMEAGEVAVPLTPPIRLMRGIIVNAAGQRFINEDTYFGRIGQTALYQQQGRMWLVVDSDVYEVNRAQMQATHVARTWEELEREAGFPSGSLASTMALYNRHAAAGIDPVHHKRSEFLVPLTAAPYAVIDCSVGAAIYASFTLGGLWTRPSGEVLTDEGEPIPGLYAAGRTTSGIAAFGYASGVSLADGTFFGRWAGRSAAIAQP